jgi:hypothetical protein
VLSTENETKERVTAFVFDSFESIDDEYKQQIHDNRPEKTLPSDAFRDQGDEPSLFTAASLARSSVHNPNKRLDPRLLTVGSHCMINAFLQCTGPLLKTLDVENFKADANKAYTSRPKVAGEPVSIGKVNGVQLETFLATEEAKTVMQKFGLRLLCFDHQLIASNEK